MPVKLSITYPPSACHAFDMRDVFILARKVLNKPYTDLQTQTSLPFFKLLPSQNKPAEEST